MSEKKTIGVFLGSVREGRFGEVVANWVMEKAHNREGFEYTLLDLREFDVPHLVATTPPGAANKQYEDPAVTRWSQAVDACDGYIFVTPEYNHSVPGTMKNAVDSLGAEWRGKPVAFVGYGADSAIRAVEHWRVIVANFSMFDIRNQVALSIFDDVKDGAFAPRDVKVESLETVLGDIEQQLS
ncbi:NADPH-dependent FMN reductase [Corynebacterium riegelii]|uniref:NADPH-dependent FMN reductase n=1 Tax=Corynebacterium riegelii TaxID=156976 RepID=UPI000C77A98A|nr:NAD(P)H-dependent oxidoreductase [Corynebacterium riegelii]PLA14207.1 NADPH-dependent FMN reductase [Corynebacterium riegelii]